MTEPAGSSAVVEPRRTGRAADVAAGLAVAVCCGYIVVSSVVPYLYGSAVAPLLLAATVALAVRQRSVSRAGLLWVLALTALGVLGVALGLALGNPGARATVTIFVLEPAVLGVAFLLLFQQAGAERWVRRTLDGTIVAVLVVAVALYVVRLDGGHLPTWLVDRSFSAVDVDGTLPRTNYQGFNSYVFLAAYGVHRGVAALCGRSRAAWPYLVAVAALAGTVLSGRRILVLCIPLALLLSWVVTRRGSAVATRLGVVARRRPWGCAGVGAAMLLGLLGAVGLVWLTTGALAGRTTDVRVVQSERLLERWLVSPLWGHGAGAVVPGYQRHDVTPWTFELSYHVVLLGFGLVGLAVLTAWSGWILVRLAAVGATSHPWVGAVLAGWLSTLLATATNPYLFKLDGMWMVMVPFGIAAVGTSRWRIGHGG